MNTTVIDRKQLKATHMTPRVNDAQRPGPAAQGRSQEAWARLPPATNPESPQPLPLCLAPADIEKLRVLGLEVSEMRRKVTAADQALASATKQAKQLGQLENVAGSLAAQAFRGGATAKQAASDVAQSIEEARAAASAVKPLTDERDSLMREFGQARGNLHGAATEAVRQAMLRASKRYAEHALGITESLAAIEACIEALPAHISTPLRTGWHAHTLADLSVPALPEPLRVNNEGVSSMYFRDSLCRVTHPRLVAHASAANSRLQVQLHDAIAPSGFDSKNLLA